MSYRVYHCLEGEPGVGHTLGPVIHDEPMDSLAEVYRLLLDPQVISVTIYTGNKLHAPVVGVSGALAVKLIRR